MFISSKLELYANILQLDVLLRSRDANERNNAALTVCALPHFNQEDTAVQLESPIGSLGALHMIHGTLSPDAFDMPPLDLADSFLMPASACRGYA